MDSNAGTGTLDAFMGKFSSEQRKDLGELHGVMWEFDENVTNCRECDAKFSLMLRKHHCRSCGGIFCENCCREASGPDKKKAERTCGGCRRGETPGEVVKRAAELNCAESGNNNTNNSTTKGAALTIPAVPYSLTRGSLFPEEEDNDSPTVGSVARAAAAMQSSADAIVKPPISGYFEVVNKSENDVCCIKLLTPGNHNVIFEAPRPPYLAVPPLEYAHTRFDPETPHVDLLLLYNNPNPIPASRKVVYDTSPDPRTGLPCSNISPCACVSQFKTFSIYRIPCRGCNILLKYKGGGVLERRLGNSVGRVGIFSKLVGGGVKKVGAPNQIDFATNVPSMTLVCDSRL